MLRIAISVSTATSAALPPRARLAAMISMATAGIITSNDASVRLGRTDHGCQLSCAPTSVSAACSSSRPLKLCHTNGGSGTSCTSGRTSTSAAIIQTSRLTRTNGAGARDVRIQMAAVAAVMHCRAISGRGAGDPPPPRLSAATARIAASQAWRAVERSANCKLYSPQDPSVAKFGC